MRGIAHASDGAENNLCGWHEGFLLIRTIYSLKMSSEPSVTGNVAVIPGCWGVHASRHVQSEDIPRPGIGHTPENGGLI